MGNEIKNIFNDLPHKIPGEVVETILESRTSISKG